MTRQSEPRVDFPLGPALDFLGRVWRLNHALERLSSGMDKRFGVTAQQRLVLRCIGKYPGMTAGQLATLLHVDPGTVSAALNRLETKGLLDRRRDPRDKRRALLGLTAKARALDLDAAARGTVESAVERLLETASAKDVVAMARVVDRLSALLGEELGSEPGSSSKSGAT